jgi:hypothetical protein
VKPGYTMGYTTRTDASPRLGRSMRPSPLVRDEGFASSKPATPISFLDSPLHGPAVASKQVSTCEFDDIWLDTHCERFGHQNHEIRRKSRTDLPNSRRAVRVLHVLQSQLPPGRWHHHRTRETVGGCQSFFCFGRGSDRIRRSQ